MRSMLLPTHLKVGKSFDFEGETVWPVKTPAGDFEIGHNEEYGWFVYGEDSWEPLHGDLYGFHDRFSLLRRFARYLSKNIPVPETKGKAVKPRKGYVLVSLDDAPLHPEFPPIAESADTFYLFRVKTKKTVGLMTVMPDGTHIAWDTCGVCFLHLKRCKCRVFGEARYITHLRAKITRQLAGEDEPLVRPTDGKQTEIKAPIPTFKPQARHRPAQTPAKTDTGKAKSVKKPSTQVSVPDVDVDTSDIDSLDFGELNKQAAAKASEFGEGQKKPRGRKK